MLTSTQQPVTCGPEALQRAFPLLSSPSPCACNDRSVSVHAYARSPEASSRFVTRQKQPAASPATTGNAHILSMHVNSPARANTLRAYTEQHAILSTSSRAAAGGFQQTHLLKPPVRSQHIRETRIHTCESAGTLSASCKGPVRSAVLVGPACLLQLCDLLCCALLNAPCVRACVCVCVCVLLSAGSAAVADVLCCALRHRFIQNIPFPASAVPGLLRWSLKYMRSLNYRLSPEALGL